MLDSKNSDDPALTPALSPEERESNVMALDNLPIPVASADSVAFVTR